MSTLGELIKEGIDILKERSESHSNKHLKKSSDGHLNTKKKRGPYKKKEKMTRKKIPYKKTRGRRGADFSEIDKIVKENYGKKRYKQIIEIAAEKGIEISSHTIDNRRRQMGIAKASRKNTSGPKEVKKKVKEQTDEEYIKTIEESSKIDLKGLNKKTEPSETPEEEYDSAESYEN